jgi:uncharacterized membrane protein YkoI
MKAFFLAFLFTAAVSTSVAAEKPVNKADLPKPVQQAVERESTGAEIIGLSSEVEHGKTVYELEMKVNGHSRDVSIDAGGKVVEVEEEVELASLPADVRSAIQKAAGSGRVVKVEAVTKGTLTTGYLEAYEVQLQHRGRTKEVKVNANGKVLIDHD